jgi:hypothetical protein
MERGASGIDGHDTPNRLGARSVIIEVGATLVARIRP